MEYGKMLYQNPRGIGCHKCHGLKGEGLVIASYKEFDKSGETKIDKNLSAPPINSLTPQEFADGVTAVKKQSVMPSYFLTKDEIIVIYKYLKQR